MLVKGPQVSSIGTLLSGDGDEEEARKQTRSATTDCDWIPPVSADDEMPVLVKGPQVNSKRPSLSGDDEEKGAGKETRPITPEQEVK